MRYLALPSKGNPHRGLAVTYIECVLKDLNPVVIFQVEDGNKWFGTDEPGWEPRCSYKVECQGITITSTPGEQE